MPEYLKILIPNALTFVTTVCAAFLSARWAVRRSFEERWWERKEKAYSEIIDALYDLLRYAEDQASAASAALEGRALKNPKRQEFAERYSDAYWKIQKMTDIGPFVISDRASEILQTLRDRPKLPWDEVGLEVYGEESAHYREALEEIRKCARADLKVK